MTDPLNNLFGPSGSPPDIHKRFLNLFIANQNRIKAFIITFVPNAHDAADIFQESAITMWSKFDQFEPGTDFLAWGITIARNKIRDYRKKHVRAKVEFNSQTLQFLENVVKDMPLDNDDRIDILKKCISKLQEKDRLLIFLHYEEKITIKQISQRLGYSVHTLYKSMSMIHHALLKCIQHHLGMKRI